LTPDNLMLSSDGRIKLLDFNVAQQLESNTTRTVVGKHNYMAPEQFRGKPTTQSDLYSLGCTLYYLIVGADPTPLTCLKTSDKVAVPADLDELISQLTKLEPADRCPSAADAQQQVTALMKNASSTATKISES
jgi:serine/threonine protein kinase